MKEGYKSIDEILEEVAKEENMSFEETKDLWNHQKKYIKKQMDKEDVYAIFLPFIGTLSLNVKQFSAEIKGKTRKFYKTFIDKVNKLKKHDNYTEKGNAHKKITGINRLARYVIANYDTGITRNKNLILPKKCWEIIYKYSNGQFNKLTKN